MNAHALLDNVKERLPARLGRGGVTTVGLVGKLASPSSNGSNMQILSFAVWCAFQPLSLASGDSYSAIGFGNCVGR